MIKLPDKCLRGRTNCIPYSQIASDNGESFFCCGVHDGTINKVLADKYTVCFKGEHDDSVALYDKRDLVHQAAVILGALAIIEEEEK